MNHKSWCPLRFEDRKERIKPFLAVFKTYKFNYETNEFEPVEAFVTCTICGAILKQKKKQS